LYCGAGAAPGAPNEAPIASVLSAILKNLTCMMTYQQTIIHIRRCENAQIHGARGFNGVSPFS
jgi:hypothetical protein